MDGSIRSNVLECFDSEICRPRWFERMFVTVADMVAEQDYFREKLRRHNVFLHGWGVVCGLEVKAAATDEEPWRVEICPGYALTPQGDEVNVHESVFLDLARCGPGAITDPCDPRVVHCGQSTRGDRLFICIKYAECLAAPVRAMSAGCACEEEACEYSRICETFQLECLEECPPSHQPPSGPSLCELIDGRQLPPCPPCIDDPCVVLAEVTLPPSPRSEVIGRHIDNFSCRRILVSTAVLQEALIRCCCEEGQADLALNFNIDNIEPDPSSTSAEPLRHVVSITVTNNGPDPAVNVTLTSELSVQGTVIENIDPGDTWDTVQGPPPPSSTATLVAEIGTLQPQETTTESFEYTAMIGVAQGATGANTIEVSSDTPDPNTANNTVVFQIFS